MTAAVYIVIAIFVVILALFVLVLYCAFEDMKHMKEYDNYIHQLQERERELDLALHTTDKILEIQNKDLSPEETNKQIQEVLHEYESVQKSDS